MGRRYCQFFQGHQFLSQYFFEKESPFSSMWLFSSWKHFPVSDCFSATQMSQGLTCLSVATHAVPSAWNASFPSLVPPACFLFILHSRLKSNSPRKPSLTLRLFSLPYYYYFNSTFYFLCSIYHGYS